MSNVVFDPSAARASRTRVPAREMGNELNVIVQLNPVSTNAKAPVGKAWAQLPTGVYELTLFADGDSYSFSMNGNYMSASLPDDVRSAILDRIDAIAHAQPAPLVVSAVKFSDFANANGAQKGFMMISFADYGNARSLKYGIGRNGQPYVMPAEIFKKPEHEGDDLKVITEGDIYRGTYKAETVNGTLVLRKSDVRTGGFYWSKELQEFAVVQAKQHLIERGYFRDINATMAAVEQTITAPVTAGEEVVIPV